MGDDICLIHDADDASARGNKKAIRSDCREDGYSGVQIGRVVGGGAHPNGWRRISSKRKKILGIDAGWEPRLRRWQCLKTHRRAASGANESWTEPRRYSRFSGVSRNGCRCKGAVPHSAWLIFRGLLKTHDFSPFRTGNYAIAIARVRLARLSRSSIAPSITTLPRLGSRVRIPSPAPICINYFSKLKTVLWGQCYLEFQFERSLLADSIHPEESCGIRHRRFGSGQAA
jgi:hypothetical protein